jgi:hypothetical protein
MATIEILKNVRPTLRWTPSVGEHTLAFTTKKSLEIPEPDELERVVLEAQTILGRCVPPTDRAGNDTGLVVGYVQSGKTLSFTTVTALARDNGFRLVVVIAGIAVNLKNQSERRLLADLGLADGSRVWAHFQNPEPAKDDATNISNILANWKVPKVPPHKRRAVLITVLKNHSRLKNLVAVLKRLDLAGVPALVIDDEGDQASMNTKNAKNRRTGSNDKSTTYDWITQLKAVLPHHTFLQYTATPQANLLIHLMDVLSPSFAELVTPGDGYVGGHEFFIRNPPFVKVIPSIDVPSPTNILSAPPASLQSALRYFLLGAAAHYVLDQKGNRSMMVHPSQHTGPHSDYKTWVENSVGAWKLFLEKSEATAEYQDCANLFKPEFAALQAGFPQIPVFDELMRVMSLVIGGTRILQVNSTPQGEKDVKWHENDYWILVGGQKLDRGFTVEGLTVTYMPRSMGTGNADTLQQRARFFGYKKSYQGLCRVFLIQDVADSFKQYVEHEEFVRDALADFSGRSLSEWKRDFILTRLMNPTRPSVIGIDIDRVSLPGGWAIPGRLYRDAQASIDNRRLVSEVVGKWSATHGSIDAATADDAFKDKRIGSPKNVLIEGVRLKAIVEEFLLQFRATDFDDSALLTALTIALGTVLKDRPDDLCDVFLIGEGQPQIRSLTSTGRINQVFMGKSPNTDDFDKLNYVGDAALFFPQRLALHVRAYDIRESKGSAIAYPNVAWFTIHVPSQSGYAKDLVIEDNRV